MENNEAKNSTTTMGVVITWRVLLFEHSLRHFDGYQQYLFTGVCVHSIATQQHTLNYTMAVIEEELDTTSLTNENGGN